MKKTKDKKLVAVVIVKQFALWVQSIGPPIQCNVNPRSIWLLRYTPLWHAIHLSALAQWRPCGIGLASWLGGSARPRALPSGRLPEAGVRANVYQAHVYSQRNVVLFSRSATADPMNKSSYFFFFFLLFYRWWSDTLSSTVYSPGFLCFAVALNAATE